MKRGLRINIFGLMTVLLMSTTGVSVYKHYCNQSKIVKSHILVLDVDCQIACCHIVKDYETQMQDDCCSHNMEYYHINSDLIKHNFKVEITKIHSLTPINGLTIAENLFEQEKKTVVPSPPPNPTTHQRLSLYQMYLI